MNVYTTVDTIEDFRSLMQIANSKNYCVSHNENYFNRGLKHVIFRYGKAVNGHYTNQIPFDAKKVTFNEFIQHLLGTYEEPMLVGDDYEVTFNEDTVKIGCQEVSKETLKELRRQIRLSDCETVDGKPIFIGFDKTIWVDGDTNNCITFDELNKIVEKMNETN